MGNIIGTNNIFSTCSSSFASGQVNCKNDKLSSLSKDVLTLLNDGMKNGFNGDCLMMYSNKQNLQKSRNINDRMIPELCEWVTKLGSKVKGLMLNSNKITSSGASMLFDTLKELEVEISNIDLSYNEKVDDNCMKSLGEYIKSNKSIEVIHANCTQISDAGIGILAPYLDGNTTFKRLDLFKNKRITEDSKETFIMIVESSCIETINISDTSITQFKKLSLLLICNSLKVKSTTLDVAFEDVNDDDMNIICDCSKKFGVDTLKVINLNFNKLTSKGLHLLLNTLIECNSIVSMLSLAYNNIDDEYIHYLDKGVEILSEFIIGNTAIKSIDFHGIEGITNMSVPHLVNMVKKSAITGLFIWDTSLSEAGQLKIKDALKISVDDREIPIKSNTKSAAKIISLST